MNTGSSPRRPVWFCGPGLHPSPDCQPKTTMAMEAAGVVTIRTPLSDGIINNPLVFFFFVLYFSDFLRFSIIQKSNPIVNNNVV